MEISVDTIKFFFEGEGERGKPDDLRIESFLEYYQMVGEA